MIQAADRRYKRGLDGQFGRDVVGRGGDCAGQIFKHEIAFDPLCLVLLIIQKLPIKHSHKAVLVIQNEVSHLGLLVAEFGDDYLDYLFVQLLVHPIVCRSGEQFLLRVLVSIVSTSVLNCHEVVDNIEIVVYHVATRNDVLIVGCT
jgi:hypothetical protein